MKVTFKKKEYEIKQPSFKQRLELTGLSAGCITSDGAIVSGEGFGKFLVKVFELSGLKESEFENLDEADYVDFITVIRSAWFADAKK